MKKLLVLAFILGLCGWAAAADKALDRDGNLYAIGSAVADGVPVLQLQIYFTTGTKGILIVPGSEGPESDASPQVYLSNNAKKFYIAFERRGTASSEIVLVTYTLGEGFTDPQVVSEAYAGAFCRNPNLAQTYEFLTDGAGHKTLLQLIHLVWWETGPVPQAVYCNIPVVLGIPDLSGKTLIRLGDLLSPGLPPGDYSGLSTGLYESPSLLVPERNRNSLAVFFADLSALEYRIVDFRYGSDPIILEDRAHFPDIGVRAPVAMPLTFSSASLISPVIGTEGRLGIYSRETSGTLFGIFCDGWGAAIRLPISVTDPEMADLLKPIVEDIR
jgi:hypothetical protein